MDIVKKIVYHMKDSEHIEPYIEYVEDRAFNDLRYSVSNKKLTQLGWSEQIGFDDGLLATIKWYMECPSTHWEIN
jgi:dTDP-D-glucose 4,6-dehydratase